jgi:Glu-tRNA(Gln) amidotransferase subunit E-like FAD-binding protein
MYLETGLGQPSKRRRKGPFISQPRVVPEDQLRSANVRWALKVPFRKDFGAFRQEVAKAIGRHVIKSARDITKVEDWILKREENEQRLKAIHDELLKRDTSKLKESDIVTVTTRFYYLRALQDPLNSVSTVEILNVS